MRVEKARKLQLPKLLDFLREIREKKIVITFHYSGDFDALASAFSLKYLLEKAKNKVWIVPPSVSGADEKLFLSRGYAFDQHDLNVDYIFIADTNSKMMLDDVYPKIEKSKAVKIILDHHVIKRNRPGIGYG